MALSPGADQTASSTTMRDASQLSVVFSFRNEAAVLPALIARVEAVLTNLRLDYELIFVDDDSTDDSLSILRRAATTNPRIKILSMSRRFGVGECILAGLTYASGDAVVYMDADLQDPPEVIPAMVEKWRDGADVVFTVRTHRHGESRLKMAVTRLAYRAIGLISEIELPVNAGDFRLISRRVRDELLKLRESDPYVRGLVRWVGFRQEPVFYERASRGAGETHFPLLTNIGPAKAFVSGLTSFSTTPLYFILIVGLVATALAILSLMTFAVLAFAGFGVGPMAVAASVIFLWGSLLAAIGITGIYVGRVYKDVRNRPPYIVREAIGFSSGSQRTKES